MNDKDNEQSTMEDESKNINDSYKTAIERIAGINNKANILASQTSFLSKGFLGSSLYNSLTDISRQFSKMNSLYGGLPDISRMVQESSALASAREANLSISRLVGTNSIFEMSKAMQASHSIFSTHSSLAALSNPLSSYLKHESSIAKLASLSTIDKSLTSLFAASSNLGRIAEYSLQAEKKLCNFQFI
ncbi:MAG: hypothetical protein A3H98_10190 [Bacteroidetes bacterium RIFCSPLOWO2_02_FULL_36_8]|nr:MAG: hypothetical protein A3H98_10190 [Bacteroidetes bacterium RIFCSPLOWO2_02_FULL_36_8]OFY71068.1 MAG: hypothetical protein A3G23_14755 [Bacteroidetes bacterium RIFCSPLOWO2_12_FULL_37_12]